jgi:hypothetical protein
MKLALIGGEVTLLAAFTGVGIHLAMQPHRVAFRPPPLVLPSLRPPALPPVAPPLLAPPTTTTATIPTAMPFAPALFARFGQQDRNLLLQQWDILQHLTSAIARYVEARVIEQVDKKH